MKYSTIANEPTNGGDPDVSAKAAGHSKEGDSHSRFYLMWIPETFLLPNFYALKFTSVPWPERKTFITPGAMLKAPMG